MIGVVYLGNNPATQEKLKYIPGQLVRMASNYKDAATLCEKSARMQHYIFFLEKTNKTEDTVALNFIKKRCPHIYVILMTGQLTDEERKAYQEIGINDTINSKATIQELARKVQFIKDREGILFDKEETKHRILSFKIPVWKRIFDIVFSLCAIVILSPVLLITALAIKMESKGPVVFKSKRVGTNYTVFDFLKFRSMYTDAEKNLKELSKSQNLYNHNTEEPAPTQLSHDDLMLTGDEENMMIGDEEVMLVGDDFVVSENDFNKQKAEDISNAFVKIENDPRVTKVGHFIRKYSIDELPQLFNILKGDMSVVGNRPLPLYEAEKLTGDDCIDRFMAPAGLTGLWQVAEHGSNGEKLSAEERKQLDITYGQTYSFMLDMKIIFKTLTAFRQKENS